MWVFMSHWNVHLLAHGNYVLVSNTTKWLRILLEGEVGCAPVLEQGWQNIRWLTSDDKQARVQLPQTGVQVLQTLQQESRRSEYLIQSLRMTLSSLPPFVGTHIGRPSKPGVKDEDAPKCFTSSNSSQQTRIITKSQSFSEPVNTVFSSRRFSSFTFHIFLFLFSCFT